MHVRTTIENVTLDEMSSQCSSVHTQSATLLVRGSNRIWRAAAHKMPDNELRRHFGFMFSCSGTQCTTPEG